MPKYMLTKSVLYKILIEDNKDDILLMVGNNKITNIKDLYEKVAKNINDKKNTDIDYEYCVLNNTGCGIISEQSDLNIYKKFRGGYHCKINNRYNDPDRYSYKMYQMAANFFNKKIESEQHNLGKKIKFYVDVINDYSFCLTAKIDGQPVVKLTGDWIATWEDISKCCNSMGAINITHTIAGHVFWPGHIKNKQTINQIRKNEPLEDVLNELKLWWAEQCDTNSDNRKKDNSKHKYFSAFDANREWFLVFGSFDEYVDFFCLQEFVNRNNDCVVLKIAKRKEKMKNKKTVK